MMTPGFEIKFLSKETLKNPNITLPLLISGKKLKTFVESKVLTIYFN